MTTIKVSRFDPAAKGSITRMRIVMQFMFAADNAQRDPAGFLAALADMEKLLGEIGQTNDGTPIADAIRDCSLTEMVELAGALLIIREEALPKTNATS